MIKPELLEYIDELKAYITADGGIDVFKLKETFYHDTIKITTNRLFFTCMTKTTFATFGVGQFVNRYPRSLFMFGYYHLANTLAIFNQKIVRR